MAGKVRPSSPRRQSRSTADKEKRVKKERQPGMTPGCRFYEIMCSFRLDLWMNYLRCLPYGIGLALVRAICAQGGLRVDYRFEQGRHLFQIVNNT